MDVSLVFVTVLLEVKLISAELNSTLNNERETVSALLTGFSG